MRSKLNAIPLARFSLLVGVVLFSGWINSIRTWAQDQAADQCSLIALIGPSGDSANSSVYSNGDIYVMNPDGSNLHRLTQTEDSEFYPSWSPDGKLIVFSSNRDREDIGYEDYRIPSFNLYVMNSDGSHIRRLTRFEESSNDLQPAWSPDGKWIAYYAATRTSRWIAIIGPNGESHRDLDVKSFVDPHWSPDSTQILYSGPVENERIRQKLFLIDVDGGNIAQLTYGKGSDYGASFSPDGQWIVFASTRDQPEYLEAPQSDIYVMNYATGVVKRLTMNGGYTPSWSPDGSQIAYFSPEGINVMNSDGTLPKTILTNPSAKQAGSQFIDLSGDYGFPVWSPWLCERP
ncbi:MAG: PD40 domain-containing protein [Anaerolineae bacterium]|nr:PD40 domain-containing protein [Anaerolineae bacterium]